MDLFLSDSDWENMTLLFCGNLHFEAKDGIVDSITNIRLLRDLTYPNNKWLMNLSNIVFFYASLSRSSYST